jgi:hypothetical protein
MNIEWQVSKTEQPGGGWLVRRRVVEEQVTGDPAQPDTLTVQRRIVQDGYFAYTTLSHARKSIADELRLDKRVRLRKHSDTFYNYNFTPSA